MFALHTCLLLTPRGTVPHGQLTLSELHKKSPIIYRPPKVHYCVHSILPLVPILSQMNPIHTLPKYSFKIHFNIILPPTPDLPSGFFPSPFPTKILHAFLLCPMYATCSYHLTILGMITRIYGEQKSWRSWLSNFLCTVTLSLLSPNALLTFN